jgi:hypothetical protein
VKNRAAPYPSAAELETSRIDQQNADDMSRENDDIRQSNEETQRSIDATNAASAAVSSGN